jgi:hypothetical protein
MIIINIIVGALEGFISHDVVTREATIEAFAHNLGVSKRMVERALRKLRYRKVKPTFKLGLTAAMKQARLDFAQAHCH